MSALESFDNRFGRQEYISGGSVDASNLSDVKIAAVLAEVKARRLSLADYPETREQWQKVQPVIDEHDTLWMCGEQVMMAWEQPLSELFAKLAICGLARCKGGSILDIGFGSGYSARAVANRVYVPGDSGIGVVTSWNTHVPLFEHIIIEMNNDRAEAAGRFADSVPHNVRVLHGFWEDVVGDIPDGSIAGIISDGFPLGTAGNGNEAMNQDNLPFFDEAFRLLKPGGIMTYFPDWPRELPEFHLAALREAGFDQEPPSVIFPVQPPSDCLYYPFQTIGVPAIVRPRTSSYRKDDPERAVRVAHHFEADRFNPHVLQPNIRQISRMGRSITDR